MKRRDPNRFLEHLWAIEAELVAAGMPAMPAWWRTQIERFERSGKRRMVVRKGRRVFASTCVAPRLAVAEMLFGEHEHLIGTPALTYAFLSVKVDEAAKRLTGVAAILDVLGEAYTPRGNTLELKNRPAVFCVVTANHKTSVGDTVAFAWLDEVARWSDDELGANPAEEVVGAIAPALATLPNARMWLVSSPLSTVDFHARSFDQGETGLQCVAFGATWEINPTLTEDATRALEPDARLWSIHYAAVPMASMGTAFGDIDSIFSDEIPDCYLLGENILGVDVSTMLKIGGDAIGFTIGGWLTPDNRAWWAQFTGPGGAVCEARDELGYPIRLPTPDRPMFRVHEAGEYAPAPGETQESVITKIAARAKLYGCKLATGDQFSQVSAMGYFAQAGVRYVSLPWSTASKESAVSWVRRLSRERSLVISKSESGALKNEMANLRYVVGRSGHVEYRSTGLDTLSSFLAIGTYLTTADAAAVSDRGAKPLDGTPYRAHAGGKWVIEDGGGFGRPAGGTGY